MLNSDNTRLSIFENGISINKNLPKYRTETDGETTAFSSMVNNWNFSNTITSGSVRRPNLFQRVCLWISGKKLEYKQKQFSIEGFFSNVKATLTEEELKTYTARKDDYLKVMEMAEKAGQIALKEKLFKAAVTIKYESILFAKGLRKSITEETLVKFAKDSPRALKLDYIANYTRNIPIEAIEKKLEIDEYQVFDNYLILHYDPEDKGTELTEEEKKRELEKKKDPIMFGVIRGIPKLYFICDWTDEYCDLTFDKLVEVIGKELIEKDYISDNPKY